MKDLKKLPLVDLAALRTGMYVYLDLGWMSHPFPLSHFKITTDDQIATIKTLRLKQVRWDEAQSDPEAVAALTGTSPLVAADSASAASPVTVSGQGAFEPVKAATPEQLRRQSLTAQRASLAMCEKQFSEAARECRLMNERVANAPKEAGEHALALSRALLDKMTGDEEVAIRLLSDAAGDKASAHAVNVALLSLLLARSLGWSQDEMMDLGVGALTHDVGKLDLPERVRHRQEHFGPAEQRQYEDHVAHGVSAGRLMGLSSGALLVVAQHHEMMDGTGFPTRSVPERLTKAARLVALVNRYDNLCNPHVPSLALTPHEALALMFAQGKTKFDTQLLNAFIKMMGVYPPGSLVQLSDERFAMVVSVNSSRPLKPAVLAYDRNVPRDEALILNLEQASELAIRRSVKVAGLPPAALVYLSPRQRVAYFFESACVPGSDDALRQEAA